MNEQIKKLAEQAGFTVEDGHIQSLAGKRAEKFAELIVAECIQVCADRGAHHDGLYSAWADDCSKRIGKHFGVEESKGWVCSKCGTDRTKQECPKGYTAALTGECPMIGVAQ